MLASYYKFAGVDGTVNVHHPLCDDPQFRASFDGAPIEWKLQTCDVLGCSRFDSIYCLKSWHPNASVDTYLSKTSCGNDTAARVVRGGNGSSTFLTCPHGGAALHVLETLPSLGAAQLATRCEDPKRTSEVPDPAKRNEQLQKNMRGSLQVHCRC